VAIVLSAAKRVQLVKKPQETGAFLCLEERPPTGGLLRGLICRRDFFEPSTRHVGRRAIAQWPAVVVRMLHGLVGEISVERAHVNREVVYVLWSDGLDESPGLVARMGLGYQYGPLVQSSQPDRRFLAVAAERRSPRRGPDFYSVEVVVGPEAAPELGDFVVVQAEEGDTDGTSRESAEDDPFGVATELGADARDIRLGVADGGIDVAPPGDFIFLVILGDVRQDDPDGLAA